jgi:hypothetical protein
VPFVINGLIKGEIKKPSGQYLGLICDKSLTCRGLHSNPRYFDSFTLSFGSYRESCLLVLWCAGDRCGMVDSDEDLDRSRRSGAEDRGWSSTGWVLGGRTIGSSGDTVYGLYRAQGDDERVFLG